MQHHQFLGLVQDRARLDSLGAAESATRATLETLAERVGGGLPANVGAQLPPEIGRHLDHSGSERFELSDFWQRVAERESESVGVPGAAFHARAVMSVVNDAVTGSQLETLQEQLPDEYGDLFEFEFAN